MAWAFLKAFWNALVWFWTHWYGKLAVIVGGVMGLQKWRKDWLSGPEVVLRFRSTAADSHGHLVVEVLGTGSARNVRVQKIETRRSLGIPGNPVPSVDVKQSGRLEFSAKSRRPNQLGGYDIPLDAFFMETLDAPMTITVLHEDASGRRFKTKFKVIYNDTRHQPEPRFEQVSRSRRLFTA